MKITNHKNEIIFSPNYKASEIPVHVMGCKGYFNIFDTNTNMRVGRLEGESAELQLVNDVSFLPARLIELSKLAQYIQKFY